MISKTKKPTPQSDSEVLNSGVADSGLVAAINRSTAVITFDIDGLVVEANDRFCSALGYAPAEIIGQHHRMLCDPTEASSPETVQFWDKLHRGEFVAGEFKRVAKDGSVVWIRASYNPLYGEDDSIVGFVTFASEITEAKNRSLDAQGKLAAINASQAVIEFSSTGTILAANDNFVKMLGYRDADDFVGQNHRIFCEAEESMSLEYEEFWEHLAGGESEGGEYKRVRDDASEIWIRATYNPIVDEKGTVIKVVGFATEITETKLFATDAKGKMDAIDRSQAVIEFTARGKILVANANFVSAMGYGSADEFVGKHHRIFCDEEHGQSPEYQAFWAKLGRGQFEGGEYKRLRSDGSEIWIQAMYTPIVDESGTVLKVVKFATDITEAKLSATDAKGKMEAIHRSQAVIEFTPAGEVISANDNFVSSFGYEDSSEVIGKDHRIFCDPKHTATAEYEAFWEKLCGGEFDGGEYKRVRSDGSEVWIQATYNPIVDESGTVIKIVQFASDITEAKLQAMDWGGKVSALDRSLAVVEFSVDGTILTANDNFLQTIGYGLDEIEGQHHRMFCEAEYTASTEYKVFWEQLCAGEVHSGRHKRVGKNGREVWIQASYNPILDEEGKVVKVVKFATDITEQAKAEQIKTRVTEALEVVARAAAGELTASIPSSEEEDDLEALTQGINNMIAALHNVVGEVVATSESFSEQTAGITEQTREVAHQAERLGATSEEMSANVEELTASIASIAEASNKANNLAQGASKEAVAGNIAIKDSLVAMSEIEQSSEEVVKIVTVIANIASQTNLLAFNAAIEAARAGPHGRGFAVVADEVRKLAEQSSKAASQISELIYASTQCIQRGSEVSRKASMAFEAIVEGVDATYNAVNQIARATEEQSMAAVEVNSGIQAVSAETENTAHSSKEIATAVLGLSTSADGLRALVGRFTL